MSVKLFFKLAVIQVPKLKVFIEENLEIVREVCVHQFKFLQNMYIVFNDINAQCPLTP